MNDTFSENKLKTITVLYDKNVFTKQYVSDFVFKKLWSNRIFLCDENHFKIVTLWWRRRKKPQAAAKIVTI